MKVVRIQYVRKPGHSTPIGCVVLLEDGRIGWSQCCPADQFSKKKAKDIATSRAILDDITLPFGTEKKPVPVKCIVDQFAVNGKWNYTIRRVDLIGEALVQMDEYAVSRMQQ